MPEITPTFAEPTALLRRLLTSKSAEARHFRMNIRYYNSAMAMALVRAEFVSRGPGFSKYNPTITVYGRIYDEIEAFQPGSVIITRYASVHINDTEHATSSRKHFYCVLRESLLSHLAFMLVNSSISFRNLIQSN